MAQQPFFMELFPHHTDALLNVISLFGLVHHGDGVVGIADDALALSVECQLLAAQNVFPGAPGNPRRDSGMSTSRRNGSAAGQEPGP